MVLKGSVPATWFSGSAIHVHDTLETESASLPDSCSQASLIALAAQAALLEEQKQHNKDAFCAPGAPAVGSSVSQWMDQQTIIEELPLPYPGHFWLVI